MERTGRLKCLFKGVDRIVIVLILLLSVSMGLWFYGLHAATPDELAIGLLLLALSTWLAVAVLAGVALVPVWIAVRAGRTCRKHDSHG